MIHVKKVIIAALEHRATILRANVLAAELIVLGDIDIIEHGRSKHARTRARNELENDKKRVEVMRRQLNETLDTLIWVESNEGIKDPK